MAAPSSAADSIVRVKSLLTREFKGRIQRATTFEITVNFGSRTWFRVGGLLGTPRRQFPMTVSVSVINGTPQPSIRVRLFSDLGPYATQLPAVGNAYEKAFDAISSRIKSIV
jgi:hypothetical protein